MIYRLARHFLDFLDPHPLLKAIETLREVHGVLEHVLDSKRAYFLFTEYFGEDRLIIPICRLGLKVLHRVELAIFFRLNLAVLTLNQPPLSL